jgi:hypothetical protein
VIWWLANAEIMQRGRIKSLLEVALPVPLLPNLSNFITFQRPPPPDVSLSLLWSASGRLRRCRIRPIAIEIERQATPVTRAGGVQGVVRTRLISVKGACACGGCAALCNDTKAKVVHFVFGAHWMEVNPSRLAWMAGCLATAECFWQGIAYLARSGAIHWRPTRHWGLLSRQQWWKNYSWDSASGRQAYLWTRQYKNSLGRQFLKFNSLQLWLWCPICDTGHLVDKIDLSIFRSSHLDDLHA